MYHDNEISGMVLSVVVVAMVTTGYFTTHAQYVTRLVQHTYIYVTGGNICLSLLVGACYV
jgi:hypothetical protein